MCRGCAAGHNPRHFAHKLATVKRSRNTIVVLGAGNKISCSVESHRIYGACRGTQSSCVGQVVSCSRFDPRWRSELDLGNGEPFDDLHGCHTWDSDKDQERLRWRRRVLRLAILVSHPASESKAARAVRRRLAKKPKLRMRTKPFGRMCSKKRLKNSSSARGNNFCLLWSAESRQRKVTWPSAKKEKETRCMVGNGHAMGVAAEILQHILGATEGAFQVDHPILSIEWPQPGGEGLGLSKKLQVSIEAELAILKSLLESVDELAAKNFL